MNFIYKLLRKQIRIRKLKDYSAHSELSYKQILNGIRSRYNDLNHPRDGNLLEEFIEITLLVFKKQLTYSLMGWLYQKPKVHDGRIIYLFPFHYKDDRGNEVVIEEKRSFRKIDLEQEGVLRGNGYVLCDECDLSGMLKHVYTDGVYWYNKVDNSIIDSVIDYRISIIFELTKDYQEAMQQKNQNQ